MIAMIHDNTQWPLIDVAGIELASGRKHKLAYKKKIIQFLPPPYTECTNEVPFEMQAMFDRYGDADYRYSQGVCNLLCTQTYIYEQCKCVNPQEWSARLMAAPNGNTTFEAPLCNYDDECYLEATVRLSSSTRLWNQYCSHCTHECSKVDFIITTSSVSAPSIEYANLSKPIVESRRKQMPKNWSTNWLAEFQKNYVGLEVICQATEVENYIQEPSISPIDVLSNVGGHTGLWIGISFLSLMEVVEMLYRFLRYQIHVMKQAIQNKIKKEQQINGFTKQ
ncbi:unnamed protein product [Rotaria sp. Silwood2]|nr:unnamed protein product [Rotaria sp. Silwood2]CAF3067516.1 unnamed protein product [Rotaria sp. Silwood2]CAF3993844.1 unnamed protein product [Rotaria sp. Silwood2]